MRKVASVSVLFVVAALLLFLMVGVAGAQDIPGEGEIEPEPEIEPGDEVEAEPEAEEAAEPAEAGPEGTATRIDFEIAGHVAKKGHYSIQALATGRCGWKSFTIPAQTRRGQS
mgnify:CR=1 FL=1